MELPGYEHVPADRVILRVEDIVMKERRPAHQVFSISARRWGPPARDHDAEGIAYLHGIVHVVRYQRWNALYLIVVHHLTESRTQDNLIKNRGYAEVADRRSGNILGREEGRDVKVVCWMR